LFNIQKNKTATKRLKWRSVFIEMLLKKIKENLKSYKEKIADFEKEDYLISWWKFILIWENFDEGKFNNFKKEIEEKLFKEFYAELKIIFWVSNWDGKESSFKKSLIKAYEDVEKNKLRAFESIFIKNWEWNEEKFVFDEKIIWNWKEVTRWPQSVCKFSRDRLVDDVMTKIINEKYLWGNEEKLKDFYGDDKSNWKISKEAGNDILITEWVRSWKNLWIKILDKDKIDDVLEKFDREKLKKWLPFDENENQIKTFEDLAWESNFNKLAALKWDIDNLGEIFQFDLEDENYYENYKKLSDVLDKFWTEQLYDFIEKNYKNKLYVVYAGWDDFVILWKWDDVIDFYADLLALFKAYVKNKKFDDNFDYSDWIQINWEKIIVKNLFKSSDNSQNKSSEIPLHFSWAINLFSPHDTFFTVVKNTDKLLEEAKEWNKDQINIFGQVLKNEDFVKILQEAKEFKQKFVDTDIVSMGTLRFLLDIWRKIKLEKSDWKDENWNKRDFFEYGTWKSELFYHLGRNYRGEVGRKNQKKSEEKIKFREYINWMLLKNWVEKFESLSWNDNLFESEIGEKLIVMMSLLLYWERDKS